MSHVTIAYLDRDIIGIVKSHTLVETSRAAGSRENRSLRLARRQQPIGPHAGIEHLLVHDGAVLVRPGTRILIPQTEIHGQLPGDLPIVLKVGRITRGPEVRIGQSESPLNAGHLPEQQIGHREPRRVPVGWIPRVLSGETEIRKRELLTDLVIAVAPNLTTELERVAAPGHGYVVHELERRVAENERIAR